MLTAVNIVIFCFFSWWFAWGLHQADTDRHRAHAETITLNEGLEARVIERTAELEKTFMALRSSEEKFRAVAETANEAFISADCQGNVIHWNRGAEQIFGYTFAEMLGKPLVTIMPQRFRAAHRHGVQRFLATGEAAVVGKTVELAGQRKDGSEFPLELSLADWTTAEGKFFTGVIRDISDRKRAEEELTKRASELARSNRELEDFAFVASHDLQEPLRMISSYSQLLSKRYRDKLGSDADDFIGFIVGGATRMQRLIEDLLQYARITTKGNSFALVSIQEVVDQTVANLRPLIAESNATITLDPLPTINGDDVQLGQLFQNLIGNAIKYHGPEPPVIRVSSQWNGREWLFSVSDNGIGIEPMNQDKIFVIFQRLHGRSEYEGTGIGLAVCKKIVERHGGNIWVDSKLGEGSTFCFALPGEST
jgi:PAS domain S-box-containing protein